MTPEQWRKINNTLMWPSGRIELRVDSYRVELSVVPLRPRRYVIAVYVNGGFSGEWMRKKGDDWHEEARRFLPLKRNRVFSEKSLKGVRKRLAAEWRRERCETRDYYWSSVGALKRHFIANNASIELVAIDGRVVA